MNSLILIFIFAHFFQLPKCMLNNLTYLWSVFVLRWQHDFEIFMTKKWLQFNMTFIWIEVNIGRLPHRHQTQQPFWPFKFVSFTENWLQKMAPTQASNSTVIWSQREVYKVFTIEFIIAGAMMFGIFLLLWLYLKYFHRQKPAYQRMKEVSFLFCHCN